MKDDTTQIQFNFPSTIVARGDGSYVVTPGKPIIETELTPRQAAKFLGISRPSVYRMLDQGFIACRRPSPGKILIPVEALRIHKNASRDPEFWDKLRKPSQSA